MKKKSLSRSDSTWVFFLIFLAANLLLSYSSISLETKLWIGLVGLILPLVALLRASFTKASTKPPLYLLEFLPPISIWVFIGIGILALGVRFYRLDSLSLWPHFDEGLYGFYALKIGHLWDWRLLYGHSQAPPFYIWIQAGLFKILSPSLRTIWLLPALISMATPPLSYLAARRFFSKSLSLLILFLFSTCFWSFYVARFSFMTVLVPLGECLVLFLLGNLLKSTNFEDGKKKAVWLSLGLGFGFYLHIHWFVISGFLLLFLAFWLRGKSGHLAASLFLPGSLLCVPLLYASLQNGYGMYLRDLLPSSQTSGILQQTTTIFQYLSAIFWGLGPEFHTYQPFWGGFLNPVLDALFLMGLAEIIKNAKIPLYRFLLAALIFFFLPALLTQTLEPFRLLPMLPILLAVTALGWGCLCRGLPKNKIIPATTLLLVFSFGLDFYHLAGPYHRNWDDPQHWRNSLKSIERYRAYVILKKTASENGPGMIFSDFVPGNCDPTLTLADYSFNAAKNPSLKQDQAQWTAVLANIHYQSFLAQRFPGSQAYPLSKDLRGGDGGLMLWIAPLSTLNRPIVNKWQEASQSLLPFIDQCLSYVHGKPFQPVLDSLAKVYPCFEGDPFLESVYWEKTADSDLKMNLPDHQAAIQSLKEGLKKGYPAAHLYYDLGVFYSMDQNPVKAREAFQQARKAPFDFTSSEQFLRESPE